MKSSKTKSDQGIENEIEKNRLLIDLQYVLNRTLKYITVIILFKVVANSR